MANYIATDTDLTAVANAIRTKGGTSEALTFPSGFVSAVAAIPSGGSPTLITKNITENGTYAASGDNADGYSSVTVNVASDPYPIARQILSRAITSYIDDGLTELGHSAFRNCGNLTTLQVHGVTKVNPSCIENTKVTALALPSLDTSLAGMNSAYGSCSTLHYLDYGEGVTSVGTTSMTFANLQVLILRRAASLVAGAGSSFNQTPMKSGGAGVTVYIPKALYDHLGDGSSLDYKNATTWSTYDAYGTITWAQIEGSIYETQYADGTAVGS